MPAPNIELPLPAVTEELPSGQQSTRFWKGEIDRLDRNDHAVMNQLTLLSEQLKLLHDQHAQTLQELESMRGVLQALIATKEV